MRLPSAITNRRLYAPILLLFMSAVSGMTAWTQTFQVIHYFSPQGYNPADGLTVDSAGNLYGTTASGGSLSGQCAAYPGCGTVFRLTLHNSSWTYASLYNFQWGSDGAYPLAAPVFGPDGNLYGTTYNGGGSMYCQNLGCGTVYKLRPPPTVCRSVSCYWFEEVIYAFAVQTEYDGQSPDARVTFDPAGNLYGTTHLGGDIQLGGTNDGTIYELTPLQGSWTETILHTFQGYPIDIGEPSSGVILDASGNVYGTGGGLDCGLHQTCGAVYQLSPRQGEWDYQFIHEFSQPGDGNAPAGAPIWDAAGNMYGSTAEGNIDGDNGPVIWKLSPTSTGWTETILYTWPLGAAGGNGSLTMDAYGNLYGVQASYGNGNGSVFKLTNNNGVWVYSTLHQFSGEDGSYPNGSPVVDSNGNVFGTTTYGGMVAPQCPQGCGVVFKISQQ